MKKNVKCLISILLCAFLAVALCACTNMYDERYNALGEADYEYDNCVENESEGIWNHWTESGSGKGGEDDGDKGGTQSGNNGSGNNTGSSGSGAGSVTGGIATGGNATGGNASGGIVTGGIGNNGTTENRPLKRNYYDRQDYCYLQDEWIDMYPLGAATELEGTIAVFALFLDDKNTKWDFDDPKDFKLYSLMYENEKVACEYLKNVAAEYGREVNFIWDWMENNDLIVRGKLKADVAASVNNGNPDYQTWELIMDKVKPEEVCSYLGADGAIFIEYINVPESNKTSSCTRCFYKEMPYPYEIVYIFPKKNGQIDSPAVIAHEMLHDFGAPDLYMPSDGYNDCRITQKYVNYAKEIRLNDIMRITYNERTGKYRYDRIDQEVTEITAYYVGLTDYSATVEEWNFGESEHFVGSR